MSVNPKFCFLSLALKLLLVLYRTSQEIFKILMIGLCCHLPFEKILKKVRTSPSSVRPPFLRLSEDDCSVFMKIFCEPHSLLPWWGKFFFNQIGHLLPWPMWGTVPGPCCRTRKACTVTGLHCVLLAASICSFVL